MSSVVLDRCDPADSDCKTCNRECRLGPTTLRVPVVPTLGYLVMHPVNKDDWFPAFGLVDKPYPVRGRRPRLPISWCLAAHEDVHRPPSISLSTGPFAGMTEEKQG